MSEAIRKVNVIGHLNPDTDSICSAIAYAYLKNKVENTTIYEARRAGSVNRETAFALKHFGFSEPPLITTVTPQIKDTEVQKQAGIDAETSLFEAWNVMRESKTDTLSITDGDDNLLGLIATKDIANANLDIFDIEVLGNSKTKLSNIVSTLNDGGHRQGRRPRPRDQPLRDPAVRRGRRGQLHRRLLRRLRVQPGQGVGRAPRLHHHRHPLRHLRRRATDLHVHPCARQDDLREVDHQVQPEHLRRRRQEDHRQLAPPLLPRHQRGRQVRGPRQHPEPALRKEEARHPG